MAFKRFIRIRLGPDEQVSSKHINAMQDNIEAAIGQVVGKDMLDRRVVVASLTPSGVNSVPHTLGRAARGFNVVRRDSDFRVWDASGTNIAPSLTLPVFASATGVASLEVF